MTQCARNRCPTTVKLIVEKINTCVHNMLRTCKPLTKSKRTCLNTTCKNRYANTQIQASADGSSGRNAEKLEAILKGDVCMPRSMRRSLVVSKMSLNHHSVPASHAGHLLSEAELHLPNFNTLLMLAFLASSSSSSDMSCAASGTTNVHGMVSKRTLDNKPTTSTRLIPFCKSATRYQLQLYNNSWRCHVLKSIHLQE